MAGPREQPLPPDVAGRDLGLLELAPHAIEFRSQLVEILFRKRDLRAPRTERAERRLHAHDFLADVGLLQLQLWLALQHRLKARDLRFHRRQPLHLCVNVGVARRVVAGGDLGDVALHL